MESAILSGKSKKDLQLLVELAEKLGIKARLLSNEEKADLSIGKAIKDGRTGQLVDTDEFLKSLKRSLKLINGFKKIYSLKDSQVNSSAKAIRFLCIRKGKIS